MLKNRFILFILVNFTVINFAFALSKVKPKQDFIENSYKYDLSISDIGDEIDSSIDEIKFLNSNNNILYRLNDNNEYQSEGYLFADIKSLQKNFHFDIARFIEKSDADDLNSAKRLFYSEFDFNDNSIRYILPYYVPREWGGAAHPPVHKIEYDLDLYSKDYIKLDYKNIDSMFFEPKFHKALDKSTNSDLTIGNNLQLFQDNKSYDKKIELIKNAKKQIWIANLIIGCDKYASKLNDLLIKKHNEGVEVKVIVEGIADRYFKDLSCAYKLKKAGIQVFRKSDIFRFIKYKGFSVFHNKQIIIDLSIAMIGGQNLNKADLASKGTDFLNRDSDVLIQGPAVLDIISSYLDTWDYFRNKITTRKSKYIDLKAKYKDYLSQTRLVQNKLAQRGQKNYKDWLTNKNTRMNGVCRFINQTPFNNKNAIAKAMIAYMDNSKTYIAWTDQLRTLSQSSQREGLLNKLSRFTWYNKMYNSLINFASKENSKIDWITSSTESSGNEHVMLLKDKV